MAKKEQPPLRRVIGLDAHPTLFSAAALTGSDALQARVEWVADRVPLPQLERVLKKKVPTGTVIALEASGNSFAVAARLTAVGFDARVLESQAVGKVGKAYCATDKVDAIKVGRVYLSGLAHEVWRPNAQAAERRELFFGHRNAVRDVVRARNRIWAFLNQQCLRRPAGLQLNTPAALPTLLKLHTWTPMQQVLLREEVEALQSAEQRRQRLRTEIATAVASDPNVLQLVRLLGVRDKVAFAVSAFIGAIERFENPKKLVAYFGLNPCVSRSGTSGGNGGLAKYGRADVRALLIQAAQSILRHGQGPTYRWAVALKMRKGATIAVAALARKLVVSLWYLMKGLFTPLTEVTTQLKIKMHKIACEIGSERIRALGFVSNREFEERKLEELLRIS